MLMRNIQGIIVTDKIFKMILNNKGEKVCIVNIVVVK